MVVALSKSVRLTLFVLVILGTFGAQDLAAEGKGPKFKGAYIYGDSLSDTGNLNALTSIQPPQLPATTPPYFLGRSSNGPLWIETLVELLDIDVDLEVYVTTDPLASMQAFSGALTGTANTNIPINPATAGTGILSQIASFEDAGGKIKRHDLIVVWGGANDYFFGDPTPDPVMVVNNLKRAVEELNALGGYFFVVPNLPNLGDTPLAIEFGLQDELNFLTAIHNEVLEVVMEELREDLKVKIIVLDINEAFEESEDLFANQTFPCIIQDPPNPPQINEFICPLNPDGVPDSTANGGTLYMDLVHPTTQAHTLLGAFAFGVITEAWRKPAQN